VKRVCYKSIGEDRHSLVNPFGRILLDLNHRVLLKNAATEGGRRSRDDERSRARSPCEIFSQ
jgi:hypothetical protein